MRISHIETCFQLNVLVHIKKKKQNPRTHTYSSLNPCMENMGCDSYKPIKWWFVLRFSLKLYAVPIVFVIVPGIAFSVISIKEFLSIFV